ncbi:cellobiohydrolase [Neocallimastix lanati (nom. inval.)]|uniref:Glucanase n=1 Tax=Neocallimastix californiae TaxID=1754190 RepID=A0A1Y2D4U5_9FUNG|nr:cellobiohydrolase [Neocallimastix sp. JGI-2020a]ORY54116.1 cellobiohydrolase [Neocallimastix californiae]|eukprot:ORY54116.1 cellobiohydrolase [Neocallimastix californiae]
MKFFVCASILSATLFKLANAACAGPYAQCGGNNFSGEKCCQSGYKCVTINEWYSQCEVDNSAPAVPPTPPTSNAAPWENQNPWGNQNQQQQNPWENQNPWGNQNQQQQNPWSNQNQQQQNPWGNQNQPQAPQQQQAPVNNSGSGSSQNFFQNEIYANPKFIEEVNSSMAKLDGDLKAKAEKVKSVPTAVWLAWEGAPGEVAQHLEAAGTKTVVFIMYMIPTRDCNANASAGGASSLEAYKGHVDNIANTIKSHPNSKVVMILEPDTLGNLVTANSEACKNVHTLHKNALSYGVNVFGSMSNVSVYIDAAHGAWLGNSTDKVAAVIKEILNNAPNGKIRGLSTNISNYQPVASEYGYHQKLASALSAVGVPDMHFVVDTGRNGVGISSDTWCNLVGTGFGERSKGNPNPGMPLLDAYMWLKTPGEADGSSSGARADPGCAKSDSLPGAPDAGQWFHEYFVQLLKNAKPGF